MKNWLSIWSIGQNGTFKDFVEIKEAGFDGIEIWCEHIQSKEYLDFAKQIGLKVGLHLPFHDLNLASPDPVVRARTFALLTDWIERLSEYGGLHATFHGGYAWSSEEREETLIRARDFILSLGEKAKLLGVELLLENLIPDKLNYCHHVASNVEEWIDLLNETGIKACLDIGHLAVMGNSLEETIIKLGDSLGAIHLSDNDGKSDLHLLPGEGNSLSKNLFEILKNQNFDGPVIYEINPYKYSLQEIVHNFLKEKQPI
jgi:sugar phosphate isomerase/epimerase